MRTLLRQKARANTLCYAISRKITLELAHELANDFHTYRNMSLDAPHGDLFVRLKKLPAYSENLEAGFFKLKRLLFGSLAYDF